MNKQQILIVDDEAINREILKTMFDEYDKLNYPFSMLDTIKTEEI